MARAKLQVVAIVGRVNVGKSKLFNAILGEKRALVSGTAGTTRDTNEGVAQWRDTIFTLVDTGGLERKAQKEVDVATVAKAQKTIDIADRIVFLLDAQTGVTNEDQIIARDLKKRQRDVIVAVNKVDSPAEHDTLDASYFRLGFKRVLTLSATSGMGIGDLMDEIVSGFNTRTAAQQQQAIRLALVGKTNTGKSSIINALCGDNRVIVSSDPHTTREPRDLVVTFHGRNYVFVDTAGIRKERKINDELERAANLMSAQSVKKVKIAVIVTDVTQPLTMHDFHVLDIALRERVGIIILANKWDSIAAKDPTTMKEFEQKYRRALTMVPWAPIIFTSAVTRQRLDDMFDAAEKIRNAQCEIIPQHRLDTFLTKLLKRFAPGQREGIKKPRIFSLIQEHVDPQSFRLVVNEPRTVHPSFLRFVENRLRDAFDFTGVPIRFTLTTVKETKQ